jgi:hypothetical protein
LRSDRVVADERLGTYQVDGDFGFEVSYGTFDGWLEALLGGTWANNIVKVGTTQRSFSVLRRFSDVSLYQIFSGVSPNKMSLSVKPNGIVTGSFGLLGKDLTTTLPAGSTYGASLAYSPMDCFTSGLYEAGVLNSIITGIDFTIENGLEAAYVVGQKPAIQLSWGRCRVSGKITAFIQDWVLFNKFVNETASNINFTLGDGTRSLTFVFPNIKYNTGDAPTSDEKPIVMDIGFDAIYDSLSATSIQINRAPAVSGSPSVSPSVSKSPSLSPSVSPSVSLSPSKSLSPSVSPS